MTKDRFRFRAWDKKNKKMLYNIQEAYDGGCVEDEKGNEVEDCYADCFSSFFPYDDNDKNEEFIVEQCTGLKDKNGRLIYENDVVKITGDVMTMPLKYMDCLFKVIWADIGFCFEMLNENDGLGFCECWEYEVVGNLHENPELLEDNNASKN